MEQQPVRAYNIGNARDKIEFWIKFLRVWAIVVDSQLTKKEMETLATALVSPYEKPFNGNALDNLAKIMNVSFNTIAMHKSNLRKKKALEKDGTITPSIMTVVKAVKANDKWKIEIPIKFSLDETK